MMQFDGAVVLSVSSHFASPSASSLSLWSPTRAAAAPHWIHFSWDARPRSNYAKLSSYCHLLFSLFLSFLLYAMFLVFLFLRLLPPQNAKDCGKLASWPPESLACLPAWHLRDMGFACPFNAKWFVKPWVTSEVSLSHESLRNSLTLHSAQPSSI